MMAHPNCGREHATTRKASVARRHRDLAWAAGFLEGEGNFASTSSHSQQVTAVQVNREPAERMLALFGGTLYLRPQRGRRDAWRWTVCGSRARGVMLTLYPLLSVKRQAQIRAGLEV
jgi:hypothetical protein